MNQSTKNAKNVDLEIYNFDREIASLFRIAEREFTERNYELFQKYDRTLTTLSQSKASRRKALRMIITVARFTKKNFEELSREDMDQIFYEVMKSFANNKGQETWQSYDCKKHFKLFMRWVLTGNRTKSEEPDPKQIRGIIMKIPKDRLAREDLLTPDDLSKILDGCAGDLMHKAMIHVQWEAGTRPSELLNMRNKHVTFDEFGAIMKVDYKTNARPVRLVESVPTLTAWLNNHPFKENPEHPLWIMRNNRDFGRGMTYYSTRRQLQTVFANSGVQKRVFLNLFRHSEATRMAKILTEPELKKRQGWTASSKMVARYVHMVDADVEEKILAHYGLKGVEKEEAIRVPKVCPTCTFVNPPENEMCSRCSKPFSVDIALKMEHDKQDEMKMMWNEIQRLQSALSG